MAKRIRVPLALSLLLPVLAHAHARLVSPAPRSALAATSGPCGGVARGGSPMILQSGQMLTVQWEEFQDHTGYYRLLFSAANDTSFTVLADNLPDMSIPMGMTSNTYSAAVQIPSTPCAACTLQLIFVTTGATADYYSCADIQIAAVTTTTTTTAPGATSTTTTTTLPADACSESTGFTRAQCLLDGALADSFCEGSIDAKLDQALQGLLRKTRTLVQRAAVLTETTRLDRVLRLADRRLASAVARVTRFYNLGRVDESCNLEVLAFLADLRATLTALQ